MTNPDDSPPPSNNEWQGFRELDRAIAENRLTEYTFKKAWADRWERYALIATGVLFVAFAVFVVIYDGLL
jgi:hypothetical protein